MTSVASFFTEKQEVNSDWVRIGGIAAALQILSRFD